MEQSESVGSQIFPLIRRRLLPLWLASVWPYALGAGCMISISFAVHASAASGHMVSPLDQWHSMSGLAKLAIILAFIAQVSLLPDLGTVGVAMIVRSDRQRENLDLKSFVSRYARIVWLVVPVSISLGTLILIGWVFILPLFLAPWSAFVMPALAAAQDNPGTAIRRSFRFSLRRFGPLLGLALATGVAQIPALLALFVPGAMLEGGPWWWVGQLVGWSLFAVLMGLIAMTRSVVLALLYLDAVRSEETTRATLLT